MIHKLVALIRHELRMTFGDRNTILIMLVTPFLLASIIGFAFSNITNDQVSLHIPVGLVNLDQPADSEGSQSGDLLDMGAIFENVLIANPSIEPSEKQLQLWELLDTRAVASAEQARQAVDAGELRAAIILPANLSQNLRQMQQTGQPVQSEIEIYGDPTAQTSVQIVEMVVEQISNQVLSGNLTVTAVMNSLLELVQSNPQYASLLGAQNNQVISEIFRDSFDTSNPIELLEIRSEGQSNQGNVFVFFGAGQAIFFALFAATSTINSLRHEQRDGQLKRLLSTATPRSTILLGKMLSSVVICSVQISILLIALTLVNNVIRGEWSLIFGHNLVLIAVLIVAVSLAASGFSTFVVSLANTPEQAALIGNMLTLVMSLLGGAFVNLSLTGPMRILSRFTINYWGVQGFESLAAGSTAIVPNLLILSAIGIVGLGLGFVIFQRRLELA